MKKLLSLLFLCACAYATPPREKWRALLGGASNGAMSPTLRVAKKPLYQESGGTLVSKDKAANYMNRLEAKLEDTLRKPGIQISRIGTDVRVVMVRSSLIYTDSPEISKMGDDLLGDLVDVLKEYNSTWIEITGYTDSMANQENAVALSRDMASRVAVYFAKHGIKPIRMFVNGRGSANPIADQSDIGRLMNLRIEVRLSIVN
ncbi:MAG: OmpA family protein [Rickettsiales bacterium]|jgi:outer membrane protein OmpA-like peptidoglycan-associated protein|nr:OmpA family protein [Rickettsiales bacterium]